MQIIKISLLYINLIYQIFCHTLFIKFLTISWYHHCETALWYIDNPQFLLNQIIIVIPKYHDNIKISFQIIKLSNIWYFNLGSCRLIFWYIMIISNHDNIKIFQIINLSNVWYFNKISNMLFDILIYHDYIKMSFQIITLSNV